MSQADSRRARPTLSDDDLLAAEVAADGATVSLDVSLDVSRDLQPEETPVRLGLAALADADAPGFLGGDLVSGVLTVTRRRHRVVG